MNSHDTYLRLQETAERTPDGCLLVTIGSPSRGYRKISVDGKGQWVHRLAMSEILGRPLLPGRAETVDHECHNRSGCDLGEDCPHRRCIEPTHLALADQTENWRRGRLGVQAKRRAKTHCDFGHPYEPANIRANKNGWRGCKACHRAAAAGRSKADEPTYL